MGSTLLQVRDMTLAYGAVSVLNQTEIDVHRGEIFALVGPNGAGKTTLLRAIAGLEQPASGVIEFDGEDISSLRAEARVQRGLVTVFGGEAVFGELSVHANLVVGGDLIQNDAATLATRIDDAYATFPRLAERRAALAVQLSGGEQQMLGLAKAMLLAPSLLCIDELSLGLAPTLVARLLDRVREQRNRGTTVLLVEQSLSVAAAVADRVATFERGRVVSIDDAAAVAAP